MKFDEIVEIIGNFGRIQKIVYLIISIPCISGGIVMTLSVILLGIPEHRCKIPQLPNDSFIYGKENSALRSMVSFFVPLSEKQGGPMYERCHLYSSALDTKQYDFAVTNHDFFTNSSANMTKISCSEWVYDDSDFTETFVSKLDLVCDNQYKVSMAQSIFFGGVLIGAFFFGTMSDVIGRKKTFCIGLALLFLSSFTLAFVHGYTLYVVLRFFNGLAFSGTFLISYVIGVEIVGPSFRKFTGIVNECFFAFGECLLAGIGYWLRDWYHVQLAISIPMVLFLFYWWLVPESPRWLVNQKRYDEAEVLLRKAAKFNKVQLPDQLFTKDTEEEVSRRENLIMHMRTKKLFYRSMIIFYNWFVVSIIYYGLTLNSGNLSGNVYLNFFISGAVEFPAYILSVIFLDVYGRKKLHCICMLTGGIACLCTIFPVLYGGPKLQPMTTTLSMIGKLGSAGGFAIIYIYSAELFPTTVRNAGIGVSSAAARMGGIVAPQVAALAFRIGGKLGTALPLIIFGSISVLAGLLTLLLPETLNTHLPETIADAENFGTVNYMRKVEIVKRNSEEAQFLHGDNEMDAAN